MDDGCDVEACFCFQPLNKSLKTRSHRKEKNQDRTTADMAALVIDSSDGRRGPDAEVEKNLVVVVKTCKATSDDDRIKLH